MDGSETQMTGDGEVRGKLGKRVDRLIPNVLTQALREPVADVVAQELELYDGPTSDTLWARVRVDMQHVYYYDMLTITIEPCPTARRLQFKAHTLHSRRNAKNFHQPRWVPPKDVGVSLLDSPRLHEQKIGDSDNLWEHNAFISLKMEWLCTMYDEAYGCPNLECEVYTVQHRSRIDPENVAERNVIRILNDGRQMPSFACDFDAEAWDVGELSFTVPLKCNIFWVLLSAPRDADGTLRSAAGLHEFLIHEDRLVVSTNALLTYEDDIEGPDRRRVPRPRLLHRRRKDFRPRPYFRDYTLKHTVLAEFISRAVCDVPRFDPPDYYGPV